MKKGLITTLLVTMMTLTLVSCNEDKEKAETPTNGVEVSEKDNNGSDENSQIKKVSKEEVVRIHEETIKRLENFYDKYNLPYYKENTYNNEVEVSELSLNSALAIQSGLDIKNMDFAKYNLTQKFTVDSPIALKWDSDMTLSQTIVPEYCKAVINEDVDFKNIDDVVKNYVANPNNNSVSETFEVGDYTIKVSMSEVDYLAVFIKSNYEVK